MTDKVREMDLYPILAMLLKERKRVDHLIRILESFERGETVTEAERESRRRGRKSMSPQERKDVSRRMRKYWASRRDGGSDSVDEEIDR